MFYSYCYMHAGEIEAHTGYRKEVAEAGIDRFVLDMVGEPFYGYRGDYGIGSRYKRHVGTVRDRYERYLSELLRRRNTIAVSYEQMVLSFPSWLEKIVAACDLIDPEETRAIVAARHANSVAAERKMSGHTNARSHRAIIARNCSLKQSGSWTGSSQACSKSLGTSAAPTLKAVFRSRRREINRKRLDWRNSPTELCDSRSGLLPIRRSFA
jgi:hypothetical protein